MGLGPGLGVCVPVCVKGWRGGGGGELIEFLKGGT